MPIAVPDNWPEWPQESLEHLGYCPVCSCTERTTLYTNLIDRWVHAPGCWSMHQCHECASGYIDPRPDQDSIVLAYANYDVTHRPIESCSATNRLSARLRNGYLNTKYGYMMQPESRLGYLAMHLLPPPLRLEWDHLARHLPKPVPEHNKLLDVGCGNGEFLARARWQGWDVHGIDADESALAHARDAGISVTQGEITPEQFPVNCFDAITSHQVIEHTHKPIDFLQTLYSWLKPGGRIWLGTPNITSALHREFGADWYSLHPPQHLIIFSPKALIYAMASVGFSGIKFLPRGYLDSHSHRKSQKMQDTKDVGDWKLFNQKKGVPSPLITQVKLETRAWLRPAECSDLVAIARKPDQ